MLSTKEFSLSELTNPHAAVGNGQHLVLAAVSLIAALVSIELFPEPALSGELGVGCTKVEINPPADGRCFFSCIYLHNATDEIKQSWADAKRNPQGFALESWRQRKEDCFQQSCVCVCA